MGVPVFLLDEQCTVLFPSYCLTSSYPYTCLQHYQNLLLFNETTDWKNESIFNLEPQIPFGYT